MKSLVLAGILCCGAVFACGQTETYQKCMDSAKTQSELTVCAGEDAKAADAELNRTYQELLAKAKDDAVAVEKIRAAQRAWVAFRDAQLNAIFPRKDKQAEYGTMFPMCYDNAAADMTRQRTAQLRRMLEHWSDGGPACDY